MEYKSDSLFSVEFFTKNGILYMSLYKDSKKVYKMEEFYVKRSIRIRKIR